MVSEKLQVPGTCPSKLSKRCTGCLQKTIFAFADISSPVKVTAREQMKASVKSVL